MLEGSERSGSSLGHSIRPIECAEQVKGPESVRRARVEPKRLDRGVPDQFYECRYHVPIATLDEKPLSMKAPQKIRAL
jgi:hypothetical protein